MEFITASSWKVITPYGQQLRDKLPWYPQELCNDWPHQASAMSFGESSIIKYGLSYPRRTGLDSADEGDFVEYTEYFQNPSKSADGHVEECFVHRGVCVLSLGPIGGPSYLKGIYRPLNSYGTGIGIRSVVKAEFSRCIEGVPGPVEGKESYICLAERAGISLYSENSCDSQVTYLPEFHIERILPCNLGLLVIPVRQDSDSSSSPDKNLYILSHPIKQVSRVWFRSNPAQDYVEYNGAGERLLGCDKDLCVFWSLKHDKIILRRLVKLEAADIMHSAAITMTNTFFQTASHDQTSTNPVRPLTPHPNLNLYSPFRRPSTSNGNRPSVNKEGSNIYMWPAMDQNSMNDASMNHGLAHGFYPPHICVYDEAEAYLRNLFHIDLAKGRWEVPHKFRFATAAPSYSISSKNRIALLSQIRTRIYLHGVDVNSGKKLCHYCIKDVQDFGCSNGERDGISFIVILQTTGELKIGWFDNDFQIACSTVIQPDLRDSYDIKNIHNVFYGDTIVCGVQSSSKGEKVLVELKNYHKNGLICKTIDGFKRELNYRIVVQIIAKYMENSPKPKFMEIEGVKVQSFFDYEWLAFLQVIDDVVSAEAVNQRGVLASKMLRVLESLKENIKIHASAGNYLEKLQQLEATITKFTKSKAGKKTVPSKPKSVFLKFSELMMKDNPSNENHFEDLPDVMQILLDNPDDVRNLERLVNIKASEASYAPALEILIADVLLRNQTKVKFDWPEAVVRAVGRFDYLSGINPLNSVMKDKVFQVFTPYRERDEVNEEVTWMSHVLKMQIFSEDRRLEEVCRLLDSASPLVIDVEQRAEMSDHEYVEEQEKNLLQLVQVAFSAPVGRAAFTLRTEEKNFANLTSHIFLPKLCISGKCATKGTSIDLNDSDLPASYTSWPTFHNAVASALAVRFIDSPADAWFAYNKTKTNEGSEQAGMVLGFGLNGILSSMPPTLRHEYLAKENSFTTMSMLLGLSANLAGTGDIQTWKLVSLHISAMLPACTTELEIPRFATLVAPLSLGLLFLGTHNSHIAKVLLGEISKRYSPLSVFGTNAFNNSATNVNIAEMSAISPDREAHTLCAGFGLGFVNLGKGRLNDGSLEEGIDGILRRFVVGGPKPAHPHADEEEVMNQYGQSLPSLWEEYRCCHIEEGDNVNVDVTSPAAIIAVSLIYLRSGNEAVLKWLSPPSTLHLLDGVRPDLLVLRALASILVFDHVSEPNVMWLEDTLMPEALIEKALKQPDKNSRTDHESINQAWASIMCGYCLGLGIRFAGTSDAKYALGLEKYKFFDFAVIYNPKLL
ncbi:unnamed protein product [Allacma fusca]|uniref:Anaphase-promoting complex subunit 1 n=1 Tax=Allacma fusca TaxID=39272 RepID=A0A8J2PPP4_9HEXA|nr:unnamed protein product [Allacma fusca]